MKFTDDEWRLIDEFAGRILPALLSADSPAVWDFGPGALVPAEVTAVRTTLARIAYDIAIKMVEQRQRIKD